MGHMGKVEDAKATNPNLPLSTMPCITYLQTSSAPLSGIKTRCMMGVQKKGFWSNFYT